MLDSILDPKLVLRAFKHTRLYELRLDVELMRELKRRGLSVEEAIERCLEIEAQLAQP